MPSRYSAFQSTPSARRATVQHPGGFQQLPISIHALREEGDIAAGNRSAAHLYFNPRPPRGGRLVWTEMPSRYSAFQSTPSARRATVRHDRTYQQGLISIHALREEGDSSDTTRFCSARNFNPRPPRGGRRLILLVFRAVTLFQSTPSARRATRPLLDTSALFAISIHALREEGDSKSGEKIHHVCSIIHTCAQFEKELYEGSGEMQNKSC